MHTITLLPDYNVLPWLADANVNYHANAIMPPPLPHIMVYFEFVPHFRILLSVNGPHSYALKILSLRHTTLTGHLALYILQQASNMYSQKSH